MYKFEKLTVWNESLELVKSIYLLCGQLPQDEKSNLIDQIRSASTSVVLNIAEGSGSDNDREFQRYIAIAKRSTFEVIATLKLIQYLYKLDVAEPLTKSESISKMLSGLGKYLRSSMSHKVHDL